MNIPAVLFMSDGSFGWLGLFQDANLLPSKNLSQDRVKESEVLNLFI